MNNELKTTDLIIEAEQSAFRRPPPEFTTTADERFIEAAELEFCGDPLNTSARRFIFICAVCARFPEVEGSAAFPAHVVFACLSKPTELAAWTQDLDRYMALFNDWADDVGFIPANPCFDDITEISEKILAGWTGDGNAVDEESTGESGATSPGGASTSQP